MHLGVLAFLLTLRSLLHHECRLQEDCWWDRSSARLSQEEVVVVVVVVEEEEEEEGAHQDVTDDRVQCDGAIIRPSASPLNDTEIVFKNI